MLQVIQHLQHAPAPALLAALLAIALTPIAIPVGRRLGFVKELRDRDIHTRAIPRLGGIALFLAFAVAILVFAPGPDSNRLLVPLGATTLLFALDDRWDLSAPVKLGIQVVVAMVAIAGLGYRIEFLNLPLVHVDHLGLLAVPLTLFWIVGMQNAVNLLDGIDGLAAGVVGIVALTLLVAAAGRPGQEQVLVFSAALAGVCVGFLVFNAHPARIFMGDSGAMFLGLALALLSVIGVAKVAVVFALALPLVALAVPIADTAAAIVRRRRSGTSVAHPDTRHIHHQLLDFGLSQRETCYVLYGATAILGSIGLMIFGHRRILVVAIVLVVVGISTMLGERMQRSGWRLPAAWLGPLLSGRAVR